MYSKHSRMSERYSSLLFTAYNTLFVLCILATVDPVDPVEGTAGRAFDTSTTAPILSIKRKEESFASDIPSLPPSLSAIDTT